VKLAELAERLGCRLEGDESLDVTRVAGIEEAGPGDVTFLANSRYLSRLTGTRASAVIADDSVAGAPCAVLRSPHPYVTCASSMIGR
jgi:UDP-3-O-[3-hydroxymyristoyl] glucosamine N-acyltransferase